MGGAEASDGDVERAAVELTQMLFEAAYAVEDEQQQKWRVAVEAAAAELAVEGYVALDDATATTASGLGRIACSDTHVAEDLSGSDTEPTAV